MFYRKQSLLFVALVCAVFVSCNDNPKPEVTTPPAVAEAPTPTIPYSVVNTFAHDTTLFTEGFLFHKGQLFESTGSPDGANLKSMVGITDLKTGKFQKKIEIDEKVYFGEGIVILNDKLYQLTYKNQMGFVYDLATFKQLSTFTYINAEGWGMTTDGKEIIMSDGTDALSFLNPADLKPVKTLKVLDAGVPQIYLNELEYINGYIYANVWTTNFIVKIDPKTGKVVGRLDLAPLAYEAKKGNPMAEVLNGIAYDAPTDKIYVTGKMWAKIFELKFEH